MSIGLYNEKPITNRRTVKTLVRLRIACYQLSRPCVRCCYNTAESKVAASPLCFFKRDYRLWRNTVISSQDIGIASLCVIIVYGEINWSQVKTLSRIHCTCFRHIPFTCLVSLLYISIYFE